MIIVIIACGSTIGFICLAATLYLCCTTHGFTFGAAPKTAAKAPTRVSMSEISGTDSLFGKSSSQLDADALAGITGKKISMKALDSSRVQESHPGSDYLANFKVSGEIVHADGQAAEHSSRDSPTTGPDSSEIEARLFEADLEEEEPVMRPITESYAPEMLAGSVGRFGTGMKPKLHAFRPAASEADTSLVWNTPGPEGKMEPITLSADLVVLSSSFSEEVVDEGRSPGPMESRTPPASDMVGDRDTCLGPNREDLARTRRAS